MNLSETHVLAAGKAISLLDPATVTATANGTGVAIGPGARGHAAAVVMVDAAGAGSSPTFDYKLQSSDALGGTYVDVPGAAIAQVTTVKSVTLLPFLPGQVGKFIRGVVTIGGTSSPSFVASVALIYWDTP